MGKKKKQQTKKKARRRKGVRSRGLNNTQVSQPAVTSFVMRNTGGLRTLRLKHREMVYDVEGLATPGLSNTLEINPGLPATFPWLSAIANRFETYQFNSFNVLYIPATGTTTEGALTIAPDYDAADADGDANYDKRSFLAFEDSVRGPLWNIFRMNASKHNLCKRKTYFVRNEPLTENLHSKDIKMYDTAAVFLYLSNDVAQDGVNIGEIWVEYDVTFHTPQIEPETQQVLKVRQTTYSDAKFFPSSSTATGDSSVASFRSDDLNFLEINRPGYWRVLLHAYTEGIWDQITHPVNGGGPIKTFEALEHFTDSTIGDNLVSDLIVEVEDSCTSKNPAILYYGGNSTTSATIDDLDVTVSLIGKKVYDTLRTIHLDVKKKKVVKKCKKNDEEKTEGIKIIEQVLQNIQCKGNTGKI